jgi:hypothetical protein
MRAARRRFFVNERAVLEPQQQLLAAFRADFYTVFPPLPPRMPLSFR